MARKLLLYAAAGLGVLLVVQFVISVVFAALALVWLALVTTVTVAVLFAAGYGTYKLYGLASRDGKASSGHTDAAVRSDRRDPVERLRDQYASGEISEQELEHRLEQELTTQEMDSIDRELQRERR
jgi:hypothetical protein